MASLGKRLHRDNRNVETIDVRQPSIAHLDDVDATVSAFGSLYDAHVDEVYRFVHRRCRDNELAEDITQETFLRAIRSVDDPNTISVGWLITVARNLLYDVVRRRSRYQDKLRLIGAGVPEGDGVYDATLIERLRVEAALEELSVDYRLVLTLHYLDGLTVPALAEQMGRTVKSAEGLVTRARRALRDLLAETDGDVKGGEVS